MSHDDLIQDSKGFNEEMMKNTMIILDDLFPQDGIEASLAHLDLSRIAMNDEVTKQQRKTIKISGDKIFKDTEATLKNGNVVIFRGLERGSTEVVNQWIENCPFLKKMIEVFILDDATKEIEAEIRNGSALDEKFHNEMIMGQEKDDDEGYYKIVTSSDKYLHNSKFLGCSMCMGRFFIKIKNRMQIFLQ